MDDIYSELKKRYRKLGFFNYLYFIIRWQLVDFNKIEKLVSKKGNILDFGCGRGILSSFLALNSEDRQVTGIDINQHTIRQAKIVSQDINNITFSTQKIEEIEKKFDVIIMSDVLHHLSRDKHKQIIFKLKDKLTENGKLIIQDIDKKAFPKYLVGWLIDVLFCGRKNIFYRSKEEIINILKEAEFNIKFSKEDKIAHIIFIASIK